MNDTYKFKVKRKGKKTPVEVRFSESYFGLDETEDLQGATVCVLEFPNKEIYSGVALLHPNEIADRWIGIRHSFGRAVDDFVANTAPHRYYWRQAKTALWSAFIRAYNGH